MQITEALTHLEQTQLDIAQGRLDGMLFFVLRHWHRLIQLLAFLAGGR